MAKVSIVMGSDSDLPVMDTVADVNLVGQDLLDLFLRPNAGFLLVPFIDMRERPIPLVVEITGRGDTFRH